jgi:DNA-binding beta-propeller fold protein YncE
VPGVVNQFAVGADGSPLPLVPDTVTAGVTPTAMVSDPSGKHVYVVNLGAATISQYAVTAGGTLAPLSPASVSIGGSFTQPVGYLASVDPGGRFLYVVANPPPASGTGPQFAVFIAQYAIGSDGSLRPLATPYIIVPAATSGALAIDPGGHHAYLAVGSAVYPFTIEADGTLSIMSPVTVTPTALGVALAPSGQFAYVLSRCIDISCDGQLAIYTVEATGELVATGSTMNLGTHIVPVELLINASGQAAYLLTNLMGVDTSTGRLFLYGPIEPDGTLGTDTSMIREAPLSGSAVTASLHGGDVYVLISDPLPAAPGQIAHFASDLTNLGLTNLIPGRVTAMTIVSP